jgi:DNA-binding response OmpR family regulator
MPIVDGYSSTKMIRSFEKTHPGSCLSDRAKCNHRIPIFAVSASLVEKERKKYIDLGFDGWLLKPVDFKRVDQLLRGIIDEGTRNNCLYEPGKWEQGGWFTALQDHPDAFAVDTHPSQAKPTQETEKELAEGRIREATVAEDADNSPPGSITPKAEPAAIADS